MYGSADNLKEVFATHRIQAVLQNSDDAYLEDLLITASAIMDGFFQQRYLVPIDPDSLLEDPTLADYLHKWLARICYGMVADILFAASKDVPKPAIALKAFAAKMVEEIAKGTRTIPYIPTTDRKIFAIAGDRENSITHELFDRSRYNV